MKGKSSSCSTSATEVPATRRRPSVSAHGRGARWWWPAPRAGRPRPGGRRRSRSTSIGDAVERGQRLARDHLARRPCDRAAAGEVDDAVEVGEDRVDVVGDEQHGDALARGRSAATSAATARLVGQVEAVERLVEQQQLRPADQRLGDQQPLLLAAGELADRPLGVGAGADELDHLVDPRARPRAPAAPSGSRQRHAPAVAVEAEPDDVDAADPRAARRSCAAAAGSRSARSPSPGGRPSTVDRARGERQQAEHGLEQRRLARRRWARGPRRTRPRRPSRSTSLQIVRPPSRTAAPLARRRRPRAGRATVIAPRRLRAAPPRAPRAGATCQSWKLAPRGRQRLGDRRDRDARCARPRR